MKQPDSKYLVYTSAGDNANLACWLKSAGEQKTAKNFDLWITYYGDQKNRYKELSDFYNMRRGGKFQNLFHVYQEWHDIVTHYEAVFVLDDDMIIDCNGINRLFEIREHLDLWILQPAFHPNGKISHPITRENPFTYLRYTNFVEVGCPLFRRDKLDAFMELFDPLLTGWGIDLWYMHLFGYDPKKIAIVDDITCINPYDDTKGGQREILRLEKQDVSKEKWNTIKKKHNISCGPKDIKQFSHIKRAEAKYKGTRRNHLCPCNSMSKYKHCHGKVI